MQLEHQYHLFDIALSLAYFTTDDLVFMKKNVFVLFSTFKQKKPVNC